MDKIQPKTLFIGKNTIYLPSCHSTNDIAAEMIQVSEVFDGTIVITSNQTAGRGQRGNIWETLPEQNITVSIILKPTFLTANEQFKLNIAISVGILDFLATYITSDNLKVKWPNDLYVGDRKLGGILIENTISGSRIANSIVGIGLNINQLIFKDKKAISLKEITKSDELNLKKLIEELCQTIENTYFQLRNNQSDSLKMRYLQQLYRYQEKHLFKQNDTQFLGQIIGIDSIGRLALEVNNDLKYFNFKEIEFAF